MTDDPDLINDQELSRTLIPLMKGVIYADDDPRRWESLLKLQVRIRDTVKILGLELKLFEDEGFAWLATRLPREEETPLPRLVRRIPLSYPVSLLLALLRRKLVEFDSTSSEARLILDRQDLVEQMRSFLPTGANEARLVDQLDSTINKVVDLGFVRKLRNDPGKIEVRRILKAFVDGQWLNEFDQRLQDYRQHLQESS